MSLHGITKGTAFEKIVNMMAAGEANGTMMYYSLARLAKEQGFEDVAAEFITAANQEAVHAGFYATLNGKCPQNFWQLLRGVMKVEINGEAKIMEMAAKFREAGLAEAAAEMEVFAKEEGHHGKMLEKILRKYQPELLEDKEGKIYVCSCCGYEYVGDLDSEDDSYVCPLCGQKKEVFHLKAAQ